MIELEAASTKVLDNMLARLPMMAKQFNGEFPAYGEGKRYKLTPNQNWLASFWSGLLWLGYAAGQDTKLRRHAESLLPTYAARLDQRIRLNHDLGFMFTLSGRAQYQLTHDEYSRTLALRAAHELARRYNSTGRYLQAWHEIGDPEEAGRFIIDTMLNIPLLFWASEMTGKPSYRDIATAHAETSQRFLVRDDGSTYHSYFLNPQTGEPLYPRTHQGHSDTSLWVRGQAWAITGFAVAADWTGRTDFLATAQQTAERFMAELSPNGVPLWDLRLPPDAPQYPDSSASAIAAAGLLRLARLSDGDSSYRGWAVQLLEALIRDCYDDDEAAQGFLKHGTLHARKGWGIDAYVIFGDYFFLEALLMLHERAPDFWGPVREAQQTT